jgi:catechol 2,3-dioxygenase-like lactoylglutathione lyase family enzyme
MATLNGLNHVVLTTADMAKTVDFYTNVLGLPVKATVGRTQGTPEPGALVQNVEGVGSDWQRLYFFDLGRDALIVFAEFPDGIPEPAPSYFGIIWPDERVSPTPAGGMDHVAWNVDSEDDLRFFQKRLREHGYDVSEIIGPTTSRPSPPFVKSIYFRDPNGHNLEIATWDFDDPAWATRPPEMWFADPDPVPGVGGPSAA